MTPPDPPADPPGSGPRSRTDTSRGEPSRSETSSAIPKPIDPMTTTGSIPPPTTGRTRTGTLFTNENPFWRFFKRWGFPLFILLIVIWGRAVLLPFVFAGLIAYVLAPIVDRMSTRKDGARRMPRAVAILLCYFVFIAGIVGFLFLLVPRLTTDIARIGGEVPGMATKLNREAIPEIAHWLEARFPSLAPVKTPPPDQPPLADVPLPPATAFTITPLPDGRLSVQVVGNGVDLTPLADGSFHLHAKEAPPEPQNVEDKLRKYLARAMTSLQSKLDDLVQLGQSLIAGFIRGIFLFFFTLMLAAFILLDVDKVHRFLRSLFPANVRDDYEVIKAGIDQGLSGVIRGQLLICLVNGVLTYIGLLIFGVKYSLILAIVAGMMSLIPIFGSILSSVPIVAVALVSGDDGIDVFRGVAMTLWIIGIHFIEANLLNPKIIGSAAKIHPVFVVFALFLGESGYGLVGALLAVPILSAIQVVFLFLYRKTWKDQRQSGLMAIPPIKP
jgi:predicted PurR-regulated permease PerM